MSTSNKSNAVATELDHGAKPIILRTSALYFKYLFSLFNMQKNRRYTHSKFISTSEL